MRDLEICYLPVQWRRLEPAHLSVATCVVIDVIRATSTLAIALKNGAAGVRPVAGVEEAFALKAKNPAALLAGERGGQALPGFDLGNSPREVTVEKVQGRDIILTTTNGTQALAACRGAKEIITASFLNLEAAAKRLRKIGAPWIILCAGFEGDFGLDDAIVAGALAEALEQENSFRALYQSVRHELAATLLGCSAGRELVKVGLQDDVPICAELNQVALVPTLDADGVLRALIFKS
jgi:2-phosphosulfolactate phosphatase